MAVTDPSVVAHSATGVVFVVGAEMTSKWTARAALAQLDAARPNYLGAILNKVEVRRHPGISIPSITARNIRRTIRSRERNDVLNALGDVRGRDAGV